MADICNHQKVWAGFMVNRDAHASAPRLPVQSTPSHQPWICGECGEEGLEPFGNGPLFFTSEMTEAYRNARVKFGKSRTVLSDFQWHNERDNNGTVGYASRGIPRVSRR